MDLKINTNKSNMLVQYYSHHTGSLDLSQEVVVSFNNMLVQYYNHHTGSLDLSQEVVVSFNNNAIEVFV